MRFNVEIIDKCSIFQKAKALWKLKARGSHAPTPESVGSMYGANQWGKSSTKTIPICQEPCMYNWLVVTGTMEFYDFPYIYIYIGTFIIPSDVNSIIFQRGRSTTNQYNNRIESFMALAIRK